MPRVLYLSHGTSDVYAIIAAEVPRGFELVTLETNDDDERCRRIADCEVAIVAAYPLRRPVIEAARSLRLVHHQGVGWQDTTDHALLRERGIALALTPEGTTTGVAEHTVLLMLAALRLLPHADSELRQGRFHINALRPRSRELQGLTVGLVGMGRIARAVVQRLQPFGVHCLYHDPAVGGAVDGAEACGLDDLLRRSDIVSLHVPLTAQTRHLIGAAQIGRMKRGAYIVNTARGGLVDEAALVDALQSGHLAGAALDVFETEPMPAGHPLATLPNVVLTPHISAGTRDALATKMRALFANVQRFYAGDDLRNRVF